MQILIKHNPKYGEELEVIAIGLNQLGHQVSLFYESIFKISEQFEPEVVINIEEISEDIAQYVKNFNIKLFNLTNETLAELGRFANTIKFPQQLPDFSLQSDLLILTNSENLEEIVEFADNSELKVKICGSQFVSSPHFIGLANPSEIVKLAKSSKVVITSNPVIRDSLLLQNICAVDFEFYKKNEKYFEPHYIENLVITSKPLIQTIAQVAKKIDEKLRNIN